MKSFANLSNLTIVSAFLVGCVTAPVQTPAEPTDPATRLAAMMAGDYQRADAEVRMSDPLRDRRVRVDSMGSGQWIYHQVNEGSNWNSVERQRILSLRTQPNGRVVQTTYSLTAPETYQAMGDSLSALTRGQLRPELGEGCEMIWIEMPNGWAGQVDPNRCLITSPTQRGELRMGARADLIGNRLRRAETGYDLDGNHLWGSEDGQWLVLYRTP